MLIYIPIIAFATLMLVISYTGYRYYVRPGRYFEKIGTVSVPSSITDDGVEAPGYTIRIIQKIGERVPISPQEAVMDRRLLIAAGYRDEGALPIYYGIRVLIMAACIIAAFLIQRQIEIGTLKMVAFLMGGVIGFFVPGLLLDMKVSMRQEIIRLSLPDALDLMVVCVEAGLGLDQAIAKVSEELSITHPQLCEEFALITLEMRAGKRRMEALRNLAERTGEPELRKLVAILIQTDRFGTSIAESLRTHSEYMRTRRRQEAEERAAKVGVKLVFPIFFCILPAMLCVVAGPGILQIIKQLFPMMKQFTQSQGL
jgi:tight adherence protein C